MHTKLVNEWKMPTEQLKSQNLMFAETCEHFISKDISRFLSDEHCESKNTTPNKSVFSILYTEYQKVTQELNELRWVRLAYDIYFDKEMNGCWLFSENENSEFSVPLAEVAAIFGAINQFSEVQSKGKSEPTKLYKIFDSGTPLPQVEQHINKVIYDPINQWTIPTLKQLKSITRLSNTPFNLSAGTYSFLGGHYALYRHNDSVKGFYCNHQSPLGKDAGYSIPFLIEQKAFSQRVIYNLIEKRFNAIRVRA